MTCQGPEQTEINRSVADGDAVSTNCMLQHDELEDANTCMNNNILSPFKVKKDMEITT